MGRVSPSPTQLSQVFSTALITSSPCLYQPLHLVDGANHLHRFLRTASAATPLTSRVMIRSPPSLLSIPANQREGEAAKGAAQTKPTPALLRERSNHTPDLANGVSTDTGNLLL